MFACQKGNYEIVNYLVENEAQINMYDFGGLNALAYAFRRNNVNIIYYLIKNGSMLSKYNVEIVYASYNKNFKMVKYLINNNNVNTKTVFNETALMCACQNGDLKIVKFLIKYGSFINVKDINQNTPYIYALKHNKIGITLYIKKIVFKRLKI